MISGLDLLHLFDSVYLLAMASWVGIPLFLVIVVAPVVSKNLSAEAASRFLQALFSRSFAWGAIAGSIALPSLVCGALAVPELRGPSIGVQAVLLVVGILLNLYCGNVLMRRLNVVHGARSADQMRSETLDRWTMRWGSLILLIGLVLVVWHVYRPSPGSKGIVEPNPQERYDRTRNAATSALLLQREWRSTGRLS